MLQYIKHVVPLSLVLASAVNVFGNVLPSSRTSELAQRGAAPKLYSAYWSAWAYPNHEPTVDFGAGTTSKLDIVYLFSVDLSGGLGGINNQFSRFGPTWDEIDGQIELPTAEQVTTQAGALYAAKSAAPPVSGTSGAPKPPATATLHAAEVKARLGNTKADFKVAASFGGWQTDSSFYDYWTKNATTMTEFGDKAVAFCVANGYSVIDIDWEYPGTKWGAIGPQKLVSLLQAIKASIAAAKATIQLSVAVPSKGTDMDLTVTAATAKDVANAADWVNLMTYDYNNGVSQASGTHAGKTAINAAVGQITGYGIPANKLMVAWPAYARQWPMSDYCATPTASTVSSVPTTCSVVPNQPSDLAGSAFVAGDFPFSYEDSVDNQGWAGQVPYDWIDLWASWKSVGEGYFATDDGAHFGIDNVGNGEKLNGVKHFWTWVSHDDIVATCPTILTNFADLMGMFIFSINEDTTTTSDLGKNPVSGVFTAVEQCLGI